MIYTYKTTNEEVVKAYNEMLELVYKECGLDRGHSAIVAAILILGHDLNFSLTELLTTTSEPRGST